MLWDIIGRYKNHVSLSFCVIFSLTSIVWHSKRNPFAKTASYIGTGADRISGVLNSGFQLTGVLWVEIAKYQELESRYEQAQKTIEKYSLEKDRFDSLRLENDRLRRILSFSVKDEYPEVKAEVLGIRLNSISPRIIINKGEEDGIRPFMPVYTSAFDSENNNIRAIVGMVALTGKHISVIQPIIHPDFSIGIRIPASGHWAILSGNSRKKGRMVLSDLSDQSIEPTAIRKDQVFLSNDRIVITSGGDGIYPAGIPVGILEKKISELNDSTVAYVKPLVPISRLDFVHVVIKSPEKWAENWQKKINWEEHLETEFGPPVYKKDLSSVKNKAKIQVDPVSKPDAPEESNKENQSEKGRIEEKQNKPDRRRLLNLPGKP